MAAELYHEDLFGPGDQPVYSLLSNGGAPVPQLDTETFTDETQEYLENARDGPIGHPPPQESDVEDIDLEASDLDSDQVIDLSLKIQAGIVAEKQLARLPAGTSDPALQLTAQTGFQAQVDLYKNNLGLVRYIVIKQFARLGREGTAYDHFEDLIATGDLKLFLAVRSYDPLSGYEFSTYAATSIKNGIIDYLRQMRGPISYGSHPAAQQRQLRAEIKDFVMREGRAPSDIELVAIHNTWVAKEAASKKDPKRWRQANTIDIDRIRVLKVAEQVSLSVIADNLTEAEALDYWAMRVAPAAEVHGINAVIRSLAHDGLVRAFYLARLQPLQRKIMFARLTPEGSHMTHGELAVAVGSTPDSVKKMEQTARKRLRERAGEELSRLLQLYDE